MVKTGNERWDELPSRVGVIDVDALRYHHSRTQNRIDQIEAELEKAETLYNSGAGYETESIKHLGTAFNILMNSIGTFFYELPRGLCQLFRQKILRKDLNSTPGEAEQ